MNNSSIVLVLASIECQLSDWSVTTTEDGYSQEYINGRVDGLASTINTLKALIFEEEQMQIVDKHNAELSYYYDAR